MNINLFAIHFLNGISFGGALFLLAAGLSVTMGLMRIVNLAHGGLYMAGAYVGISVGKFTGEWLLGVLAGGICAGLIGLVMQTGFLNRLHRRDQDQIVLTIGFVYVLTNIAQWIWGPVPQMGIKPSVLSGSIPIGEISFPVYRLAVILIAIVLAVALWLLQEKTRVGAIIRAGMDNVQMTAVLGINVKLFFTAVFVIGAVITGFSGIIAVPILGAYLDICWDVLILAMIVVIIGGSGRVEGAMAGSLVIGLSDAFGKAIFPDFASYTMYLVMIIILLFKPSGLFGRAIQPGEQT